jgi:hypothetical protein
MLPFCMLPRILKMVLYLVVYKSVVYGRHIWYRILREEHNIML